MPMPHWCHPDSVDEDKSDDDDEFVSEPKSRRRRKYIYTLGVKKNALLVIYDLHVIASLRWLK